MVVGAASILLRLLNKRLHMFTFVPECEVLQTGTQRTFKLGFFSDNLHYKARLVFLNVPLFVTKAFIYWKDF